MLKSVLKWLKAGLVRRQLLLFGGVLLTGVSLFAPGFAALEGRPLSEAGAVTLFLISEGGAFIIIGLLGLIMSWTTFDIGSGIKEAVRESGRENQKAIDSLEKSQRELGEGLKEAIREGIKEAVRESGRQNREAVREFGRQNREAIDSLAKSQRELGEGLKEAIREGLKEAVRESGRQNGAGSPAK